MASKLEFVKQASAAGANMRALCRRYGVSPTTGYEWLRRYVKSGEAGLAERSRRAGSSPSKTAREVEEQILALRDMTHWGARKIADVLNQEGPELSLRRGTVNNVLKRNGRISKTISEQHHAWHRFEHAEPNDLWQMDFMGAFKTRGQSCHGLTVLDDHSRFSVALRACMNEQTATVQGELIGAFERYGLPWRMTMDNGSPWGDDGSGVLTKLTAWVIRLGVRVSHSRPYHPQTQGKDERFHQTLQHELVNWVVFHDLGEAQRAFDEWRDRYNMRRPHEGLNMKTPESRYRPSTRSYPHTLPPIEYETSDQVRKVDQNGMISFLNRRVRVGKGCSGMPVAIRPADTEGRYGVFFCHQQIATIDLRDGDHPERQHPHLRRDHEVRVIESCLAEPLSRRYDFFRPGRRIGQCWGATRAPLQGLRRKGLAGRRCGAPLDLNNLSDQHQSDKPTVATRGNCGSFNLLRHALAEPIYKNPLCRLLVRNVSRMSADTRPVCL